MKLHRYGQTGDWVTDKVNGHFCVISRGSVGWNIHLDGDYCFSEGFAETLKEARNEAEYILEHKEG